MVILLNCALNRQRHQFMHYHPFKKKKKFMFYINIIKDYITMFYITCIIASCLPKVTQVNDIKVILLYLFDFLLIIKS